MDKIKINLTLNNALGIAPNVKCNGKLVRFNQKGGALIGQIEAKKDELLVFEIFKYYPLADKLWFVYGFLFWLFGFFGIFTPPWERRFPSIDSKFDLVAENDLNLLISFNRFAEGYRAFNISGTQSTSAYNNSNVYFVDKVAKKHTSLVRLFSFISFVATIITAAILIILSWQ